jgi:thiol-disulfide isomerase/thioredoxin
MKLKKSFPGGLLPFGKDKNLCPFVYDGSEKPPKSVLRELWDEFKVTIIILLIAMAIMLTNVFSSFAQGVSKLPLKTGDHVPDLTISNILNYPAKSVKISDFHGKPLIVDFWATWCAPCLTMIPKLDSLQKAFLGKVIFLPVAYQSQNEVQTFFDRLQKNGKNNYAMPSVVGDTLLSQLFPHKTFPHLVWIDPDGVVAAITGEDDLTGENIQRFLKGHQFNVHQKDDTRIPYDRFEPLLINGNGNAGQHLIYHSLFTSFTQGLPFGHQYFRPDSIKGMKITCWNEGPDLLFKTAFGEGKRTFNRNRIALEVKDPSLITCSKSGYKYVEWLSHGNGHCYELIVPPSLADKTWLIMQNDLRSFFPQYHVSVQKRKTKCYALTRTSNADKLKTTGEEHMVKFDFFGCTLHDALLTEFTDKLDFFYLQNSPLPVVDETGYMGKVDLEIEAKLSSIADLNQALEKYDLKFITVEKELDILVFEDSLPFKRPNTN